MDYLLLIIFLSVALHHYINTLIEPISPGAESQMQSHIDDDEGIMIGQGEPQPHNAPVIVVQGQGQGRLQYPQRQQVPYGGDQRQMMPYNRMPLPQRVPHHVHTAMPPQQQRLRYHGLWHSLESLF